MILRKTRVGLDGRALSNINRLRGIGKYSSNLINSLVKSGSGYEFVLFGYGRHPDREVLPEEISGAVEWVEIPRMKTIPLASILIDHILFARAVNRSRVSLFHGIDHNMTPFLNCPSIITVHDLILLILKGPYLGPTSWLWMKFHQRAAQKASAVITVSDSTKNDVVRIWNIPPDRIRTVYEGVDSRYSEHPETEDDEAVVRKYGIDTPYLLYIGGFDPRKNIDNMLIGFKKHVISKGPTHKFVLCGDAKGFEGYLNDEIEQLGLRNHVRTPGFIPDEDLPAVYRKADALMFISLYEGFGLPLLESMACGTPVITARNSSIPEVAGEAALYADPLDPREIAGAISMLTGDEALRKSLAEAGTKRSLEFTWEKTAENVLELYSEILKGGRST